MDGQKLVKINFNIVKKERKKVSALIYSNSYRNAP